MKLIKTAAGVLNQTPLDWDGNLANIVAAIRCGREQSVQLLCLPELCITGYGCEDAFHSPAVCRTAVELLRAIVPETSGMLVSVGLPLVFSGVVYNTACLIGDGTIRGFVAKQNLAGDGIHYEPRWFRPWPAATRATVPVDGHDYPLGDLVFDCGGVGVGFEVCEDAWVANRPGGSLVQRGVEIVLNPSASHFAFGKHEIRKRFVLEGSRAFHAGYVYANLVGNEAGRAIYDGDALIACDGDLLAEGRRFSFADFELLTGLIDIDRIRMSRTRSTSFRPPMDFPADRIKLDFPWADAGPEPRRATSTARWEAGTSVKEEEFARAVSLGLFDYMRKSRSRGFVVSLSGGADSSAVVSLIWLMAEFAIRQLGRDEFQRKIGHLAGFDSAERPAEFIRQLLTCVYQPTRNSSQTTRDAACGVAESIGAKFLEFDVDEIFQRYVAIVSAAIGRELTWQKDDVPLQNIQARVRSPSVWLLANLNGALLLSTSNRSEAAVGYATMDGDTSGGLSPIAGIDKAFLRHWLRWLEKTGPDEVGPLPILRLVNEQQPTAELRPPEASQTDEDDLMPYEILDAIERAAIRDKMSPREVLRTLEAAAAYPREKLLAWVRRFFELWCRNQWKRERYAPSFHLDDENLDPKTWCRFPILSGGFRRELNDLES